jgi:hypothetical protein
MTEPRRPAARIPGSDAASGDPEDLVPGDYSAWRHCIEVSCGIPLTVAYVAERLCILGDPAQEATQRFVKPWGPAHLERIVGWFQQAQASLADDAAAAESYPSRMGFPVS